MSDDNDSSVPSDIMDFRGDTAPIAMESYRDNVIDDRQQSVLNDLRINLCQEDFAYLNNNKVNIPIDVVVMSISSNRMCTIY